MPWSPDEGKATQPAAPIFWGARLEGGGASLGGLVGDPGPSCRQNGHDTQGATALPERPFSRRGRRREPKLPLWFHSPKAPIWAAALVRLTLGAWLGAS